MHNIHQSLWMPRLAVWLCLALLLPLLGACSRGSSEAQAQTVTLPVRRGDLTQSVSASGQIQPLREGFLNFLTSGTVAEVFVSEGQSVKADQVLAALDTDDLDQQIREAEANLKSAQASLIELQEGPDETDIRTAESQVRAAELQASQTASSDAQASDIASAEAQLRSAQADLDVLRNPEASDVQEAELNVQNAENNLQATRESTSVAKTNAELQLERAANDLRDAQDEYSQVYWENRELENSLGSRGEELPQENKNQEEAAMRAVQSAEAAQEQARISLEEARQQEITDIRAAENQLADAQRQLDAILNPSAAAIAQAEAQVVQAEANLAELNRGGTQIDIALAQETIEQRQADLEALLAPPTNSELAQAEAQVAQAEAALSQAQQDRANAELVAAFDGVVAAVNITQGDSSTTSSSTNNTADTADIYLIDTATFNVNVSISEVDLASLSLGQSAQVTFDALPDAVVTGTLTYIAMTPTVDANVTSYETRIDLDPTDLPLRVGMNAVVSITTEERTGVLLVPNIAIQQTRDGAQVMVQQGEESVATTIETGLAGQTQTEVVSGLDDGDMVVVTVSDTETNLRMPGMFGGPPPSGGGSGSGSSGGGSRPRN